MLSLPLLLNIGNFLIYPSSKYSFLKAEAGYNWWIIQLFLFVILLGPYPVLCFWSFPSYGPCNKTKLKKSIHCVFKKTLEIRKFTILMILINVLSLIFINNRVYIYVY